MDRVPSAVHMSPFWGPHVSLAECVLDRMGSPRHSGFSKRVHLQDVYALKMYTPFLYLVSKETYLVSKEIYLVSKEIYLVSKETYLVSKETY